MTKTYDIASINRIYQGRVGEPADTARAILLLARHYPKALEMKQGFSYFYKIHQKETGALGKDEILEVINAMRDGDRIKENSSTLIGDLVEASRAVLCAEDMREIYGKLIMVEGVDKEKSNSCKIITKQIEESQKRDLVFPERNIYVRELQAVSANKDRVRN